MPVKGSNESVNSDDAAAGKPGPKKPTRPAKPQKEKEATRYNTRWDVRAAKTGKSGDATKSPDKLRDGT
jgi:hypothetical protein